MKAGANMKTSTIIVAIALGILLFSNNLFAEEATAEQKQKLCISIGGLAKVSATSKYKGIPLSVLLEKASDIKGLPETAKSIVLSAYDLPDFTMESYQQRAINNFSNDVLVQCMKEMMD